jgi:hypothetical protein
LAREIKQTFLEPQPSRIIFYIKKTVQNGNFWAIYRFAEPKLGKFAAIMALLFLGTFPRFWADMHFNVKDVPETIFFWIDIDDLLVVV